MARRGNGMKPKTGPIRDKRRSLFGRFVLGSLSTLMLAVIVAGALGAYAKYTFETKGPLATEKLVSIERGTGLRGIAERLAAEGVIDHAQLFLAAVYATSNNGKLKAGDYRFEAGVSMRDVLDDLVTGKSLVYKVTVPEGWTSQQVVERVRANEALVGDITNIPAEGTLLPETYVFERGRDRQSIIDEMSAAQTALLDALWDKRSADLPFKTREEAIILASIVEKETGVAAERPQVAAVFLNRLNKRMRLQSDPTIIYGLVGGAGSLGRPLTRADIASKTAHNTYVIDRLPPTPIANPGRAAIEAVLNPVTSDDVYFVADGTGGHAFAASLAEHQANVRKWRQIERQRRTQPAGDQARRPSTEHLSPEDVDAGDDDAQPGNAAKPSAAGNGAAPSTASPVTSTAPAPAARKPAGSPSAERAARAVSADSNDAEPPVPGTLPRSEATRSPAAKSGAMPEATAGNAVANRGPIPIPVAKPPVPGQ